MGITMDIGKNIKKTRLEKGYTINDIAEKINITKSLLSQIEQQQGKPVFKHVDCNC